jgi:uncharacterized protein YbaA (DUF1428 family)
MTMAYFDGFVLAVPTANKQKFIDHANSADMVFKEQGATRIVEAWGDDVPKGKLTDFQGAVQAKDDETVAFSWIEYPDKETRQAIAGKMDDLMKTDDRFNPEKNPMPFDGQRMIYGGFSTLFDEGESRNGSYVDGFILAVPADKKDAYREMAAQAWPLFKEYGAHRHVEAWADDVPDGKVTDFRKSVKAEDGEKVVFSFLEWPDKATRDAGQKKMMEQDFDGEMPFDGKRMIWGGFRPVVEL